jgi:bacterial/archaeal transporter family-2 protein
MAPVILMLIALIAGILLPVQAGLNHKVSQQMGHTLWGALLSFLVGTLSIILYMVWTRVPVGLGQNARNLAPVYWLPGLIGAFFVSMAIVIVPRLGAALTFALVITGQMVSALLLDHFGLLGMEVKSINFLRLLGVLMLVGGVILIRKF